MMGVRVSEWDDRKTGRKCYRLNRGWEEENRRTGIRERGAWLVVKSTRKRNTEREEWGISRVGKRNRMQVWEGRENSRQGGSKDKTALKARRRSSRFLQNMWKS